MIEQFIAQMAAQYPMVLTIVAVIGTSRLVFKTLRAAAKSFVAETESTADDQMLEKVEQSAIVKGLVWFFDLTLSIKLPGAK